MGSDLFEIAVNAGKAAIIFIMMVQLVPLLVWVERRGSAFIQSRFGPNRVGPLGFTQLLADAVKFFGKEEFIPGKSKRLLFYLAPVVALIPGAVAFGSIPLSVPILIEAFTWDVFGLLSTPMEFGPYRFAFQSFEIGIGIVFVLGVSSLGAYALLMAGWASENKYSLLGALRASAQMISYELAMGLALVGILLIYNTFDFAPMIAQQSGPMTFTWMGSEMVLPIPNWGIFYQPLGFILLFVALFAECNRTPFDLPEAEAELVAGYHTEYGGFKMNMFYIGEYGHMLVASALIVVFYFGGYDTGHWFGWHLTDEVVYNFLLNQEAVQLSVNMASVATAFFFHVVLLTKILFFLWIFIWVRWTIPRFRYDQLMDLGWKTMLPWALANTIITAVVIYIMRVPGGGQ